MVEEHGTVWDPYAYLRRRHPGWRVYESRIPGVLGCFDREQQAIWLSADLSEAERRCMLTREIAHLERVLPGDDPVTQALYAADAAHWAARCLVETTDLCAAYAATAHLPARHLYAEMARLLRVDEQTVRTRVRGLSDEEQDAVTDAIRHMPNVVV